MDAINGQLFDWIGFAKDLISFVLGSPTPRLLLQFFDAPSKKEKYIEKKYFIKEPWILYFSSQPADACVDWFKKKEAPWKFFENSSK